jgi:hypothetical protein
MASFLPFSLIRREHPTKTNTSRILLFDTRRAGTSKRLENEAWNETWNLELASVACSTRRTGTGRSYFIRVELETRRSRIYLDIWFGSDKKCVLSCDWTRAWITWAGLATVRRRSRLLFTQYGICIWSSSCCFGCLVCSGRALVWEGRMWWGHVRMHVP